ncbi:hypothetical protein EYF80_030124 [Liparis tanakae]|uniref:Uncharacterized protein n=1 Tax=Liparis tanakae TaxID=230148 RepID=A0A4Z2H1A6_9TELE|nr:hypothetical protein EYF80_030124 [Liparis tanakae]
MLRQSFPYWPQESTGTPSREIMDPSAKITHSLWYCDDKNRRVISHPSPIYPGLSIIAAPRRHRLSGIPVK